MLFFNSSFVNSNKKERFTMKLNKILSTVTIAAAGLAINSAANAALIDQYTTASSDFAQVYQNGVSVNLTVEGAGVNRTVHMSVSRYVYGDGFTYWSGTIPADAVVDNGIASTTVNVDTCGLTETVSIGDLACGPVNMTFTKQDYLWKTNGVTQYSYGDISYQLIGGISTFSAAASGTVETGGVDTNIDATNATMGKYTDVSITVSTAN
jgi:hypothetical protein